MSILESLNLLCSTRCLYRQLPQLSEMSEMRSKTYNGSDQVASECNRLKETEIADHRCCVIRHGSNVSLINANEQNYNTLDMVWTI